MAEEQEEPKGKFLFYFCGKPVYEGDETHQHIKRIKDEFNGDFTAAAKHDFKEVEKLTKEIFNNGKQHNNKRRRGKS